jgi:hypothetical protein
LASCPIDPTLASGRITGKEHGQISPPLAPLSSADSSVTSSSANQEPVRAKVSEAYGRLPLRFEANQGQAPSPVNFISRGAGYSLFLTPQEMVMVLRKQGAGRKRIAIAGRAPAAQDNATSRSVLRIKLSGANRHPRVIELEELGGKSNYFIGNDPARWRKDVPSYRKVKCQDVYPGVDMIYYGNQNRLEYDLIVNPGSGVRNIKLEFAGARKARIDRDGDLVLNLKGGEVRQLKPLAYQEVDGRRQEVHSRYVVAGRNQIGFEVGSYDQSKPLVIDPILSYSTYLGGTGEDRGYGIAVDGAGNAYVTGVTGSSNFPLVNGVMSYRGNEDAFLVKLSAAGTSLVYSTYFGGNGKDAGWDVAVDSSGAAHIPGSTTSTDLPVTPGAFDATCGTDANCNGNNLNSRSSDVVVAKFSSNGGLAYATYAGGSGVESGYGIAINSQNGDVYLTGATESADFPTTIGAFDRQCGTDNLRNPINSTNKAEDAFALQLTSNLSSLVYSTFLGSGGSDYGMDIAVDSAGNAFVAGSTDNTGFPTLSAYQPSWAGGGDASGNHPDAFVTKLNSAGAALLYSTYLGGTGKDYAEGIAIDSADSAYIVGYTLSANFPVANAYRQLYAGAGTTYDAFVAKLGLTGTQTTETETLSNGAYTFPNLAPGGSYTITPFHLNYTFTPVSQTFANLASAQNQDFVGAGGSSGGGNGTTLDPVADAYVQDGTSASKNFGAVTPMLLQTGTKAGQNRDVYLKFEQLHKSEFEGERGEAGVGYRSAISK